jgi:hypothetical protein
MPRRKAKTKKKAKKYPADANLLARSVMEATIAIRFHFQRGAFLGLDLAFQSLQLQELQEL